MAKEGEAARPTGPSRLALVHIGSAGFSGNTVTSVTGTAKVVDESGRLIAVGRLTLVEGWVAVNVKRGTKFKLIPGLDTQARLPSTWPEEASKDAARVSLSSDGVWETADGNLFFLFDTSYGARTDFAASLARATEFSLPDSYEAQLWGNKVVIGKGGGIIRVVRGKVLGGKNAKVTSPDGKTATYD